MRLSLNRPRWSAAAAAVGALTISTLGARPALAETYTLHHRIWPSQWSERGIITTSQSATSGGHAGKELFASASSASYQDTTGKQQPWERLDGYESTSESFYQLALTPGSKGKVDDLTPATFARVCQLATSGEESLTLHVSGKGDEVLALAYELPGLDAAQLAPNGCPASTANAGERSGIRVYVSQPDAPLLPLPPTPPPSKPDGTPLAEGEEPTKEKSFVAKYWMYILPVVLLMIIPTEIADSNNEEGEDGGGEGNPFQAGVQKSQRAGAAGGARKR